MITILLYNSIERYNLYLLIVWKLGGSYDQWSVTEIQGYSNSGFYIILWGCINRRKREAIDDEILDLGEPEERVVTSYLYHSYMISFHDE